MSVLVRLAVFALLVYGFVKLIRRVFPAGPPRGARPDRMIDEMVQDPVCNVYIPRREALRAVHEGRTYYFCSERCRQEFQSRHGSAGPFAARPGGTHPASGGMP